ncbi:hypothetical protein [Psychrobacter immobilis]|uniref:hypothetical protein n=1 Tax=Psychrobacter immobilis TaxID=498 RepID=UPI001918E934|nr:hypothetical protein [Psychrobacter immobilis]
MSDSQQDEQQALEKYLEAKAKQAQEVEQEVEPLSAYEACVLKESARVKELIAEAKRDYK